MGEREMGEREIGELEMGEWGITSLLIYLLYNKTNLIKDYRCKPKAVLMFHMIS